VLCGRRGCPEDVLVLEDIIIYSGADQESPERGRSSGQSRQLSKELRAQQRSALHRRNDPTLPKARYHRSWKIKANLAGQKNGSG